eukprot:10769053-Alexandrium_andersonii.AAC.1
MPVRFRPRQRSHSSSLSSPVSLGGQAWRAKAPLTDEGITHQHAIRILRVALRCLIDGLL